MFKYETHLHTFPVSKCGKATVEESLLYYKSLGYDGVFITNHFIDGNVNIDKSRPYEEKIKFYFSDYKAGVEAGKKIGIKVFCGVEMSYKGTDFLVYGLNEDWYLAHPEIEQMKKSEELTLLAQNGALIIQAHPYREAGYIDHIRLFPRHVHGVEVINSSQNAFRNEMARIYADAYGLLHFAGSDNHRGKERKALAGMWSFTPLSDERDFIDRVLSGKMWTFADDYGL